MYSSLLLYKLTMLSKLSTLVINIHRTVSRYGILFCLKKTKVIVLNKLYALFYKKKNVIRFNNLIKKHYCDSHIILYPPYHDFNLPLYQRPQHLASLLSKQYLYLFHSKGTVDSVCHIKKIKNNLFLLPPYLYSLSLRAETGGKKILFLYSNPYKKWNSTLVNQYLNQNHIVIYDFLDDLNNEIFPNIDLDALERHKQILAEKRIILFVTASKLMDQVRLYRPCLTNTHFIPNAVDIKHFQKEKKIVKNLEFLKEKNVIGYFGALASWLDYKLIERIARLNSNYHILLLGYVYDNKFKTTSIEQYDNVMVLGPIPYSSLPHYAEYFDISIIPFLINETTIATSPIKLFEYMALGKPIISTALPECKKYKSVLIADNHDEFIELIDQSFRMPKNDTYFEVMKKEAEENTWDARVKLIIECINEHPNTV